MDERRLKNWMRRSGTYKKLLDGVSRTEEVAEQASDQLFEDAIKDEEELLFLAVLDGVRFEGEMGFDGFDIVKPTAAELAAILEIETNRLFYPHGITSVDTLAEHWYLRATHRRKKVPNPRPILEPNSYIAAFQTSFPKPVENAMKLIALWDWNRFGNQEFEGGEVNFGSRVPFVIVLSDDPFKAPPLLPLTEELSPVALWTFDANKTEAFERSVSDALKQLAKTRQMRCQRGADWGFVDRALNFLLKAFLSREIEQLIWHTAAIESVLGEDVPSLTKTLKRRVKTLHPGDQRKKRAGKEFEEVYKLRSRLVHGSELAVAEKTDLRTARKLARTVSEQMLRLVSSLAELVENGTLPAVPARADILEALDQIDEGRELALYPVALAIRDLLVREGAADARMA